MVKMFSTDTYHYTLFCQLPLSLLSFGCHEQLHSEAAAVAALKQNQNYVFQVQ